MKKSFILMSTLLCLCLSFTLLVSCSGKSKDPNAGKTVVRYTRWAGTQEAKDFKILVNKFMEKYPEIYIETEFLPWGAYWEKMRTSVLSGDAADVISLSHIEASPYLTRGAFLRLNDLEGAQTRLNEMQPGTKEAVTFEGNLYAMPVGVGVRAMIYNKALLDEAGVPYPSNTEPMSWDDFISMGKKLTKKENGDVVQYAAHFHKQEMYESFVNQMGGRLIDNYTRPTKVTINSPEGIAGLDLMMELIDDEILPPYDGEWSGPWGTPDSAVATGKVCFMHVGPWGLGPVEDAGIAYGAAPLPAAKARANRGYINSLAIYRDSKQVDAAWTFIKWMTSVEGQLEFTLTGDLPANKEALDESKQSDPRPADIMAAYYSELPYIITGPMLPSAEFNSLVDDVLSQLFQHQITSREAAARLEDEGNEIIEVMFED